MDIMNRTDTIYASNENVIGVLTDSEIHLISIVQGKRALRSTLLPA